MIVLSRNRSINLNYYKIICLLKQNLNVDHESQGRKQFDLEYFPYESQNYFEIYSSTVFSIS